MFVNTWHFMQIVRVRTKSVASTKAQSSVGRAWVPEAKEVQDATICWQDDGHSILGRKGRYYVGLFTQEKYNNWSVLCKLVRPAENRHPWKTPR